MGDAPSHPFERHPHRTLLTLSLPVLGSLIAEPLTGLVDTAFVARLGSAPQAALGIGSVLVSSVLWIFNFLMIGTQTAVARAEGTGLRAQGRETAGLAMSLGLVFGLALAIGLWPLAATAVAWMGAESDALEAGSAYLRIRLIGAPGWLFTVAAFGALRGLQDMRTPLWIALASNAVNALLDPLLIFGLGPFPRLELAGAAWATTLAQWLAALLAWWAVTVQIGRPRRLRWREARALLVVGRDLFLRTGSLMVFLTATTAAANHLGAEAGAAHQAIRQLWAFTAFLLDAYATAAQTLVAWFLAAGRLPEARRVARVTCAWGALTGALLAAVLGAGTPWVIAAFVPPAAVGAFQLAWGWAIVSQPVNALAFATDGIHWGSEDYRYLRNAMLMATGIGVGALLAFRALPAPHLGWIWAAVLLWTGARAVAGLLRIWPGLGRAPLSAPTRR